MTESDTSPTQEGPVTGVPEGTKPPADPPDVVARQKSRPKIGDTRPAPATPAPPLAVVPPRGPRTAGAEQARAGTAAAATGAPAPGPAATQAAAPATGSPPAPDGKATTPAVSEGVLGSRVGTDGDDPPTGRRSRSRRRSGRDRKGKQVGRYLVCVHVQPGMTQIAMLEGRSLVEHYVSRASDDTSQIDGNVYRGRVQNVLPGMEAAFVDIGIPKNAVLYRGDVRYDRDDIEGGSSKSAQPRIEDVLKAGQTILCQVTKNPIGAKGARLTQEVSLPGRFAVLVPNSSAFGISKRLGDNERRRLRRIIDEVKPPGHGLIVRTAAEGASADELQRDITTLLEQWDSHRSGGRQIRCARTPLPGARAVGADPAARSSMPSTGAW